MMYVVYGYVITCKLLNCIGYGDKVKTRCARVKSQAPFLVKVNSQGLFVTVTVVADRSTLPWHWNKTLKQTCYTWATIVVHGVIQTAYKIHTLYKPVKPSSLMTPTVLVPSVISPGPCQAWLHFPAFVWGKLIHKKLSIEYSLQGYIGTYNKR